MFKKHYKKRSPNILFVIFRLTLSVFMFGVLILGSYSAYKHFSGLDPLKIDPMAVFNSVIAARTPAQFTKAIASFKIDPNILGKAVNKPDNQTITESPVQQTSQAPIFRFLLIADPHIDNGNLKKAIAQAKQSYPDLQFIIGLGDYSEVGTASEFKEAKSVFDAAALRYFLIPGDHDLWDCRNRHLVPTDCFKQVFGPNYQSFDFNDFKFLLLDNSDDYTGFDTAQLQWITKELDKAKTEPNKGIFVFLHEPLFHPSSDHVMGKIEPKLKSQAKELEFELKDAGVKKVFAGDIHFFSEYTEPVTGLPMITIGAVTIERNPQTPRFSVVSVFDDGNTKVDDVIISGS